jgi:hypothetical protein
VATIYSKAFWDVTLPVAGSTGPIVPGGKVWVVRDVTVQTDMSKPYHQSGGQFYLTGGTPGFIWYMPADEYESNRYYHWEGRYVLAAAAQLNVMTQLITCHLHVTGYELASP